MAMMPKTIQDEFTIEVRIKNRDGKIVSESAVRLGTAIKTSAYNPAERAAREAVTKARRELGLYPSE